MCRCSLLPGISFVLLLVCMTGCDSTVTDNTGHSHVASDALVWKVKEKVGETDYEIWLGHHGQHFHGGDSIEPAIAITQGGKPVANAKVYNHLLDPNDLDNSISDEIQTVYEPKTDDEIAHYAQADLVIPTDASQCVIRFRLVLPNHADELTRDVTISLRH